jgi:hypothetical protein
MQERAAADRSREFLYVATYLPVRKWRHVIPFLRMTSSNEAVEECRRGGQIHGQG